MNLAGTRVLVTGGAGFIGSHLVDTLVGEGAKVRVLDDFSTGKKDNVNAEAELLEGDIRDAAAVTRAMRDVACVFHLACRGVRHSIGNPRESHEVNATGALVVLAEARKVGARVVHVSTSEVYGTALRAPMDEEHPTYPETVYGGAKLAGEAYARAYFRTYGTPTVVVRPFNNFGPRSHHEGDAGEVIPRFAVRAMAGLAPVIYGDGTQTRDFIYVKDTAHWLCRIAEHDDLFGRTINLGSGVETSVNTLAELVLQAVGRTDLVPERHPPRPGDVRRHLADVTLAKKTLGFALRTGVREGIENLVAYFRARPEGVAALSSEAATINWKA